MLKVSWIYLIHNILLVNVFLLITKSIFCYKVTIKRSLVFITWMQICFIISDFIVQPFLSLEYKYIVICIGFFIGFMLILKFNIISTFIVMGVIVMINTFLTNINIILMLLFYDKNYGNALDNNFFQYTSLILLFYIFYFILKYFKVKILEISIYN